MLLGLRSSTPFIIATVWMSTFTVSPIGITNIADQKLMHPGLPSLRNGKSPDPSHLW